jgi:hypothetical protein
LYVSLSQDILFVISENCWEYPLISFIFILRYHDDPWTIPYFNTQKKDFSLSKDSGRAAARLKTTIFSTFMIVDQKENLQTL